MDEHFTGVRYFVFDNNPVKTLWEDGIVVEVYVKETNGNLKRHDGLAFYILTETTSNDAISEEAFNKLSAFKTFGVQT